MSDTNGTDSDIIRRQQERDLGHKLDHDKDTHGGPPKELLKPSERRNPHRIPVDVFDRIAPEPTRDE